MRPDPCDLCHDPGDTTTAREPSAEQREVIGLLWPELAGRRLVRRTVTQWDAVERLLSWRVQSQIEGELSA